jgi:hypothetical protein
MECVEFIIKLIKSLLPFDEDLDEKLQVRLP